MQGLLTEYAIAGDSQSVRLPAIQADNYKPNHNKSKIRLCLSVESQELLGESALAMLALEPAAGAFGDGVEIGVLGGDVRFVILAMPKMFGLAKEDGTIYPLVRGERLKDLGRVTVARLHLACLVAGSLVLDDEGLPQIFTLKLKSSKTALLGNQRDKDCGVGQNGGHPTIAGLNKALTAHYNLRGNWLTHLVSVEIGAIAESFKSTTSKDSSMGVRFVMMSGAKPLSGETQKKVFDLISTDDFKAMVADPFGLANRKETEPVADDEEVEAEVTWEGADGIPF